MSDMREVRVRVSPGARRERLEESKPGSFVVHVREEAEHGAANERVRMLVALHFNVPHASVTIVRGAHSRSKMVRIAA